MDDYHALHGCNWRACPARAAVRVVFIIGDLDFCVHHRNASGITKSTFGYAEEFDLPGADQLGAPPFREPQARKLLPPAHHDAR